ncbi:MAG: helix-turn-helix transcriptional regulator [Clostridia bacterium]|nr:helix-turn-helix transcriptional regulator [Clostridia bacterium]
MFFENELEFLCEALKKIHVRAVAVKKEAHLGAVIDVDIYSVFGMDVSAEDTVSSLAGELSQRTMYKITDELHLCYIYFQLPGADERILFIGPYLQYPIVPSVSLAPINGGSISSKSRRYADEYYSGIPVLPPDSYALIMINTFCERIWESPAFQIVDVLNASGMPPSPINETAHNDNFDAVLVNMKAMEQRYNFENELMQAVTLGQLHHEAQLISLFSDQFFEKRVSDPLRNAKNYGIIMNTLLRKAAEKGGVHPMYLDAVSSSFAMKIEQMPSLADNPSMMLEMFRSYCRLVMKHSMRDLSPVVRKTVLLIDSDLSADLSLKTLARAQGISLGYLSSVFKKETGKTVTEYIREKRVQHAAHLLGTTHLQIQTIAIHCGIMDVQYFSKVFKKETGKTPKEYRDHIKRTHNTKLSEDKQ